MVLENPYMVEELERATTMKRDAAARLASTRLELLLAKRELDAAVAAHNALYREREDARKAARHERDWGDDPGWEETVGWLLAYVDWCDDQMYNDRWYYRANDRVYYAERAIVDARLHARYCDRQLHYLLVLYREGLVIDESLTNPDWDNGWGDDYDDCCCPMCRPYLYDDDDDYGYFYQDEDPWLEEERLELEGDRRAKRVKKEKAYKRRVLRRGRKAS